jgi:hypothetical protein
MCHPQTEWLAAMRAGDLPRAWSISDAVLAAPGHAVPDDPRLPYHLRYVWDGRPFDGRRVLVRCYHGLGDTIMFARFLPHLRQRVAALMLEVQPALLPLLAGLPGPDALIPFDPVRPHPPADCDLEIMELSHALRLTPERAPPAPLTVRPGGAFARGLCWASGGWNAARDIPQALLAPFAANAVSLQRGPTSLPVLNPAGAPSALEDTAAIVAGTRLVITVDTMIAHLAGTLRRPTWLLLPHDADWRWMAGRCDSPWYPTMRLFRQDTPGDWPSVLRQLRLALAARDRVTARN